MGMEIKESELEWDKISSDYMLMENAYLDAKTKTDLIFSIIGFRCKGFKVIRIIHKELNTLNGKSMELFTTKAEALKDCKKYLKNY